MTFSILLRTRNHASELGHFEECAGRGFDMVFVDHDSADATLDFAKRWNATVVPWEKGDYSFGGALNEGVAHCKGDWIIVISPHVYPIESNFWDILRSDLEGLSPDVVACQVPVNYPGPTYRAETGIRILSKADLPVLHRMLHGNTCCAYRKSALAEMPFNENLQSAEDAEWVLRAIRHGLRVAIDGHVGVWYENRAPLSRYWRKGKTDLPAMSAIFGVNCVPSRQRTLFEIAKDIVRMGIGRIPFWWWKRIFVKRLAELTLGACLKTPEGRVENKKEGRT